MLLVVDGGAALGYSDLGGRRGVGYFVEEGIVVIVVFFFSSRRRHTRCSRDWSSDVCSSDLAPKELLLDLETDDGQHVSRDGQKELLRSWHLELTRGQYRQPRGESVAAAGEIGRASCRERV